MSGGAVPIAAPNTTRKRRRRNAVLPPRALEDKLTAVRSGIIRMYPNATAIAAPHALVTLQTIAFPPKGDVTVKARVEAAQAKLLAGLILSFPGGG